MEYIDGKITHLGKVIYSPSAKVLNYRRRTRISVPYKKVTLHVLELTNQKVFVNDEDGTIIEQADWGNEPLYMSIKD